MEYHMMEVVTELIIILLMTLNIYDYIDKLNLFIIDENTIFH